MSPMGYEEQPQGRRGDIKWLPILLFAGYMAYYYFSNQQVVPVTGRRQLVDMSREQETALGLSSYQQVLSQEHLIAVGGKWL